ncbi:MAG: hypothetical protein K2X72_10870 [Reyranella sp.]|nr:hypothetical protein [Reyranella sp.]
MLATLTTLNAATSASVDDKRKKIWVTQADGAILRVDLAGTSETVQTASSSLVSVAGNGSALVFADKDGTLSRLDPEDPGARLQVVSRSRATYGQLGLTSAAAPTAAIVTQAPSGAGPIPRTGQTLGLTKVDSGATSSVPVDGLVGVAISDGTVYVARNTGSPLRGEVGMLAGTTIKPIAGGLPPLGRLGVAERGALLLAAHASGQLSAIRPATGAVNKVSTGSLGGPLVEAHGLADGRIAVLTDNALTLIDSLADLSHDPSITPFLDPIFVGSWTEIDFDLGTSGLTRDAVHFEVPDGLDAGLVSYTRLNNLGAPVPLLVVGGAVGVHKVALIERATSKTLATAEFEITDLWSDSDTGPPGFCIADSQFDGDSGWGGGPNTPQNLNTKPHSGTWRTLVVMVDTASGRWPTDAPTMTANQTSIMGHVTNGIAFNGQTRSVRQYYEENSAFLTGKSGLTISVRNNRPLGPVNLSREWADYFEQKVDDMGNITDDRWNSKGGTVQSIITAAITNRVATANDFTDIDAIIVVPFSPDTGGRPNRFVWPHATSIASSYLCGRDLLRDWRIFTYAFAPLDFATQDDPIGANGRQMHATLSHELGHTLGLPDLYKFPTYSADVNARLTGGWDMMAGSNNILPHFSLSNKMRMGWLEASHLKLYNFQGAGLRAETVTLHPAELGPPPAGRVKGIEIRIANGRNYYVEYRAQQAATQVSDNLLTDRQVMITDVTSDDHRSAIARPPILFVPNDVDGDGRLIGPGENFVERDPGTQLDLHVEVVSTAADNAVVRIRYDSNGRPEPGIRPWPGEPDFQSPDIEIRNDRATADPGQWFNMPWAGHNNTVVAKITNNGDLLARGVAVDFAVTEFTTGDGDWESLGTDRQDVPAKTTVEFTRPWSIEADEDRHYCVRIRIQLYQDPANLAIVDLNIFNNEARSNYTRFISASASPSSRVGTEVMLSNPFDKSTLVYANVRKTHPMHRVFTSHQWLRVAGNDQRAIQVWDEAMFGTPEWPIVSRTPRGDLSPSLLWEIPNKVSVTGWAQRPFEADCGARTLTGGVGIRVAAGRATQIKVGAQRANYVTGQVVFIDDGTPVTGGGVALIEVRAASGRYFTVTADVGRNGVYTREFQNPLGGEARTVEVHYLGSYSAAPCTTGPLPV